MIDEKEQCTGSQKGPGHEVQRRNDQTIVLPV